MPYLGRLHSAPDEDSKEEPGKCARVGAAGRSGQPRRVWQRGAVGARRGGRGGGGARARGGHRRRG